MRTEKVLAVELACARGQMKREVLGTEQYYKQIVCIVYKTQSIYAIILINISFLYLWLARRLGALQFHLVPARVYR